MKKPILTSATLVTILILTIASGCAQPASAPPAPPALQTAITPPPAVTPAAAPANTPPQTVAVSPAKSASEQPYVFTTVDFPSANITRVFGINAGGDIVGNFQNPGVTPVNANHGFVLKKGGTFTAINYPGDKTLSTSAFGIGPWGDIVGNYGMKSPAPAGNLHGFLLTSNGAWVSVDYTGDGKDHLMTGPFRILPDGTMVGCVHDGNPVTVMYGVTIGPNGGVILDFPADKPYAMHYGATPNGETIVGTYTSANGTGGFGTGAVAHGYISRNGAVTPFDVPGSSATEAYDINAAGVIVGTYRNQGEGTDKAHGFVLETRNSVNPGDWEFTLLVDFPDAKITRIRGINSGGTIVGDYVGADGKNHGFTASRN